MFGDNPIRKQALDPTGALWVTDIFATIQGEGPLAGSPAIFIRLSGCNLQCVFCDTDFETSRELLTVNQVMQRAMLQHDAAGGKIPLVVITGGEPFIQNIVPLIERLHEWGFQIQIETAGTVTIDHFPWGLATVVVSPKTGKVNGQFRLMANDWKYIVSYINYDRDDGLPVDVVRPPKDATVWVQPMDQRNLYLNKANMQTCVHVAMKHGYRVSLQQHKILEVE